MSGTMTIQLTLVETGETRSYQEELREGEGLEFMWSEGNFSCDCTRAVFFARALDQEDSRDPEHQCDDSRYRARITRDSDGVVLYEDD